MKRIKILFILLVLISCSADKNKEVVARKMSDKFQGFIRLFPELTLPLEINVDTRRNLYKNDISKEFAKDYIFNFENYNSYGFSYNSDVYCYSICKLPQINNEFISLVYGLSEGFGTGKIIIANFLLKSEQKISQLVLYGDDFRTYQITSTIDTNYVISNKMVRSFRFIHYPVFKNHKGYFFIQERNRKYRMNVDGKFVKIENSKIIEELAVKDGEKYIYPVEPPEKNYTFTCLKLEYVRPTIDTLLCPKPPKDYKLLK